MLGLGLGFRSTAQRLVFYNFDLKYTWLRMYIYICVCEIIVREVFLFLICF